MNGSDRIKIGQRLTVERARLLRPLPGKNRRTGPEDTGFLYTTPNVTKLYIYA